MIGRMIAMIFSVDFCDGRCKAARIDSSLEDATLNRAIAIRPFIVPAESSFVFGTEAASLTMSICPFVGVLDSSDFEMGVDAPFSLWLI